VQREFGISQPAVSQHLRVLRDSGFTTVRADGNRRLYAVHASLFRHVAEWVERNRAYWEDRFDALDESAATARSVLAGMNDAQLATPWSMMIGDREVGAMPRGVLLRSVLFNHWYHHRGQLTGFASSGSRDGLAGGWNEAFDRLAETVAGAAR
jgi:hypothetical protein